MNDQEITLICPYCKNRASQRFLGEEKEFYNTYEMTYYYEEIDYIWQCKFCCAEWSCPPGEIIMEHAKILKDGRRNIIENYISAEEAEYREAKEVGLL